MSATKNKVECIVRGRVQLVMFRDFTKRAADRFGIMGTVRNSEDGSVFVVAEGEEKALAEFSSRLREGSFLSRVDSVETKESTPTGEYADFKILYE